MSTQPKVVLRLGSHAERDYFKKFAKFLDAVTVGANLIESTPGATSSLLCKLAGEPNDVSYLIDPMTYAYGAYFDPEISQVRTDLNWIKSDQLIDKKPVKAFKRSYRNLASRLESPFSDAIERGLAISAATLAKSTRLCAKIAENVISYQLGRIKAEFRGDGTSKALADSIPLPIAVFAPYFYIEQSDQVNWYIANMKLAQAAVSLSPSRPVHMILCADQDRLLDDDFLSHVEADVLKTGVNGIWLWFSKLDEDNATDGNLEKRLASLKRLTLSLSPRVEVYNLHGGFFSMALSPYGMAGTSHGVGYGEQKDVLPVVGQSVPTVRYYLPELHKTLSVLNILRSFKDLGIATRKDFLKEVCNCAICQGVVANAVEQFQKFGEQKPSSKGNSWVQTPAAAKRCRFHFLICRLKERALVAGTSPTALASILDQAHAKWSGPDSVKRFCCHLPVWSKLLSTKSH